MRIRSVKDYLDWAESRDLHYELEGDAKRRRRFQTKALLALVVFGVFRTAFCWYMGVTHVIWTVNVFQSDGFLSPWVPTLSTIAVFWYVMYCKQTALVSDVVREMFRLHHNWSMYQITKDDPEDGL